MIGDSLRALAAPQNRFERLRERTLLRAGRTLCDLAYANAQDGPAAQALASVRRALDEARPMDLQYTPYGGATLTRRVIARAHDAIRGRSVPWRNVVLTPGAMAGLNLLFRAIARERGDEVIVVTPCWLDYPLYLENLGLSPRYVPLHPDTLRLDLPAIARALGPRTRAIVFSQPANPTGQLYRPDELRALATVLESADAPPLLISDECHRDVLFGGAAFASPAQFYDATCVVYSFGKSWFMQGQRIGYVLVSPAWEHADAFAEELTFWARAMGFCTPTALMQHAARLLAGVRPELGGIERRRRAALHTLTGAGYDVVPSDATFFLYPRVPAGADDFGFAEQLAAAGVLVLPAPVFHDRGRFRISLTATDAALDRGLRVLAEAHPRGAAA